MALLMVHLLVADLWAQGHPEYLECPEYYYGAISPDAIHVRDHDDKSRKDEFHLYNWRSLHREPIETYWRARSQPFDIGFGVHVLTDCQWVPRYRERVPQLLLPQGGIDTNTYYNDTFVTDFRLLREIPRLGEILDMLPRAAAPEDHPLLTRAEFDEWRRLTVEAYHGECPKNGPVRYMDMDYVLDFARDSIPLIEEIHRDVFGNRA